MVDLILQHSSRDYERLALGHIDAEIDEAHHPAGRVVEKLVAVLLVFACLGLVLWSGDGELTHLQVLGFVVMLVMALLFG